MKEATPPREAEEWPRDASTCVLAYSGSAPAIALNNWVTPMAFWKTSIVLSFRRSDWSKSPVAILAGEGIHISKPSHDSLVDTVEGDLLAAMSHLRRRAGGDFRPDQHRDRFPQAAPIVPPNVKLTGWNSWQAFEAWVKERKPAVSTVNRWRVVFLDLNDFLEKRDIALMTEDDAVAWKDKLTGTGRVAAPSTRFG
ncbi:hypothetical protein [Devosia ginsengisoli]|uniref:Core-binding (CB) domain-containing protein n=1 Tax=Devosia ginsengisoli TaxID=400770 RepID=A0A5B8LRA6_9HYPH|nr:hypothetical protein [Devosia ginsengisoli]QDZ10419.1 hypothetical protein FPZ08_06460 [Devosia ginsengisoli]